MNNSLEQILSAKKINPTAMRLLVLEYLMQQVAAVSLQDIERDFHNADRITLYRTLKTFEGKGLIHTIHDGRGVTKYALCSEACSSNEHYDLHLHFNCTRCGETYCLPKVKVPEVTLPNRFKAEELKLIAKGICDRCSV
ncbi:MAG TPA: transcriptional repressor [Flavisolibacter sp.]|nr:transcriptional repressor [Flavisolibacter sp.]